MDMEKIYKFLSENLDKERFEHTLNVAKLSARLAKIHGESVEKARLAGLLHDCSKNKDYKRQIDFFKDRKQFKGFSDLAKYAPFALHSFSSAIIAEEVFLIKDKEILDAIKNHTFASVKMTALSKILFVSDSSSLDRKGKQAPLIRKLAETDLDKAFMEALQGKIIYTLQTKKWIYPKTIEIWNHYAAKQKKS